MRLSIQEAHIYITQELQRQGAYKKDKQFKQATDLAINKALTKFVRGRIKPLPQADRFEVDETSRNDIQSIIVVNHKLPVFKVNDYYISPLPPNFLYLLNDPSIVLEDCETEFKTATENKDEKLWIIKFADSTIETPPYYKKIVVSNGTLSESVDYAGLSAKEEKYAMVDEIISLFKKIGELCYWEKYKDYYYPNTFLIPIIDISKEASLTIDNVKLASTSLLKSNVIIKSGLTQENEIVPNRNTKNDFIASLRNSEYGRSEPDSPLSTVYNDQIIVYGTKRFLISQIFIDYIRQPKPVNLSLEQGFELHPNTHDRICDIAVEIIKKQIEDQSLATNIQHNQIRD
jgi:hypothetical protein